MENNTALKFGPADVTLEALRAEADALAIEVAPRRFAVFAIDDAEQDGVIVAWGQYFSDGRVVLTGDALPVHGRFNSLRAALHACGRRGILLHVAWVDPEPQP